MKKQNNLAALLRRAAKDLDEIELERFRCELRQRLPELVTEAAKAAKQTEEKQVEAK